MKAKHPLVIAISVTLLSCSSHQIADNNLIRINQIGFNPSQEKTAIWDSESIEEYKILDELKNIIDSGTTTLQTTSPLSGKKRYTINLNTATKPGSYTLVVGSNEAPFEVGQNILTALSKASIRSFYYQRSGVALDEKHAGEWKRNMAHPDTLVYIHPNASNVSQSELKTASSPYGWYDAGDYNKYIVNSAYSIGLILTGYQLIPSYYENLSLNIPESNNSTPDILDEMYFNLQWMLTMQDRADGGVYHKLTTPHFEGFIAPDKCKQKRYLVAKSTPAALDFAAVMAQAYRVYGENSNDYTDFAQQAINASKLAYEWAKKNPTISYNQKELNKTFKPEITTGEYGDRNFDDEFFWAACELYTATQEVRYLEDIKTYLPKNFSNHEWGKVDALGTFSLLINKQKLSTEGEYDNIKSLISSLEQQLLNYAEVEVKKVNDSSFNSMFGNDEKDFAWGCLADKCINPAISILIAGRLCDNTKFEEYLKNAFRNMDYVLGKNATGYCYVTGMGRKSPMNIHHRLSASDKIEKPIPGLLVGGPNQHQEDKAEGAKYSSNAPDESYSDTLPSYASNEIAINWSASLVVLAGLLDAWGE